MGSPGKVSRGGTVSNPLKRLMEPMGVEPTASRVRFETRALHRLHHPGQTRKIRTFVFHIWLQHERDRTDTRTEHGQRTLSRHAADGHALLIAYLVFFSKSLLHKDFSTAVRELSVSFKRGDGHESQSDDVRIYPLASSREAN
jgi:hypothetical protein